MAGGPAPDNLAGRNNLLQLIELRWLAVAGQLATILAVDGLLDVRLPVAEMLTLLATLALFNVACWLRSRARWGIAGAELFAGLLVDVAMLSGQLYFSGGITNPFIFLYLLLIAVGAVLLQRHYIWPMVGLTGLCFIALTQWHRPLLLPEGVSPQLPNHYIGGLLLCFVLNAALLVIFIDRISRNLRQSDARLASLRQRAAEEEHIVHMGLLASGAAHELGTPLATLSVILGDWRHMPHFTSDPELLNDLDEMQAQLKRCKGIVSGILLSAGEARGESPVESSVHDFLDELVEQWRETRKPQQLSYDNRFGDDLPIVSDSAIKQMVCNVLDNALDASPRWVGLQVLREGEDLLLTVLDRGPGFAPAMQGRIGKPYQSTKGRPGGGLGLFLSFNVARTLGGSIQAGNRNDGGSGAIVTIRLPLSAIRLDDDEEEEEAIADER